MKKVTMTVEDLRGVNYLDEAFRVTQLKNTVDWSIGEYISLEKMEVLCKDPSMDIQIVKRKI